MTDREVLIDVVIFDKQGRRQSTCTKADTLGGALNEIVRALCNAVDNDGINFGHATISISRRWDP